MDISVNRLKDADCNFSHRYCALGVAYILTAYDSSLTSYSDTYSRPGADGDVAYQRFLITTEVSGTYTFYTDSALDTYGYLYTPIFDKTSPQLNLIASDDDSAGAVQFLISYKLEAGRRYELIATTYSPNQLGPFTLIIRGPTSVNANLKPTSTCCCGSCFSLNQHL